MTTPSSAGLGGRPAAPLLRIPRSARPVPTTPRLRTVRPPLWTVAIAMLVLVVGMWAGAESLGWMQTTGRGGGPGTGERVGPTGGDPAEIKGWMTLQQVLDAYPAVDRGALYAQFGLPAEAPTDLRLGAYKSEYPGVTLEVPVLREWISAQAAPAP